MPPVNPNRSKGAKVMRDAPLMGLAEAQRLAGIDPVADEVIGQITGLGTSATAPIEAGPMTLQAEPPAVIVPAGTEPKKLTRAERRAAKAAKA